MGKQSLTQRQFPLGQVLGNFIEAKGLEIRQNSVRAAENVRTTVATTLVGKMGSDWVRAELSTSRQMFEIRPRTNLKFLVIVTDDSLRIMNEGQTITQTISGTWTNGDDVWVEPFREETVIGHPNGLHILTYSGGVFSLGDFEFDETAGGEIAQPYWAYRQKTSIGANGYSGSVTVTASNPVFTSAYVGMRIRYHGREINITGYTNASTLTGTVIGELPPTYNVTVNDASGFRVNDAVIALDTDFKGIIRGRSGNTLTIATTEGYQGPDVGEQMSSTNSTAKITGKTKLSTPSSSFFWDEPLISPVRGYPSTGRSAGGRLWLTGFDDVPDLVCASSARGPYDFEIGDNPDDGILRQIGDNAPNVLHVVNVGDLLFFTDRGIYFVPIRETKILTPNNFQALKLDDRASSEIKPVLLDGGVIFVEGNGQTVSACVLADGVYTKWRVEAISTYHDDTIKTPSKLCGPAVYSRSPQKYVFVINSDGTLAQMSWVGTFSLETVGFFPWRTEGSYVSIAPIFDGYYALVDRSFGRTLERLNEDAYLDCQVAFSDAPGPYPDGTVHVYDGQYAGTRSISDGFLDPTDISGGHIGFKFVARVTFWPVEVVNSPRAGMLVARTIRGAVDVRATSEFSVRANSRTRVFGGFDEASDLVVPPLLNHRCKFSVTGERIRPEIEFIKHEPGPFEILALTQEVQT